MEYRQTKHQVARGTRPDAVEDNKFYLIKKLKSLRATYQVRLLIFLASESGKKLIFIVPKDFKPHPSLNQLIKEFPKTIVIERNL